MFQTMVLLWLWFFGFCFFSFFRHSEAAVLSRIRSLLFLVLQLPPRDRCTTLASNTPSPKEPHVPTASSVAQTSPIRTSILQAIGNTPVVRLRKVVSPGMADVLVKLEYYN